MSVLSKIPAACPDVVIAALACLFITMTPAVATPPKPEASESIPRPNIIVIVADDMGYADAGCQGCKDIPTPHIDALARNGVRFTSGYVSCPVCSPTRAGLMTGRYQERFGHEFNPGPPVPTGLTAGLPLSEVTLADRLKSAGYRTGMVGKWHLGSGEKYHPLSRGYESYFGFLGGAHSYIDAEADPANPILRERGRASEKEYLTDAFTREAVAFIHKAAGDPALRSRSAGADKPRPFFLCLAYNAVHIPMQAAPKYLDRFPGISDLTRRTYAGMVAAMDDGVGAVLKELRSVGIERDTLIFFLSDNGGPIHSNGSRNDPLKGKKGELWEGGIREPFIVQWPAVLPAGKTDDRLVISLDILPTAVAAAGGKTEEEDNLDGVNLVPYLTGRKRQPPHEALYWRYGPDSAIRRDNCKLLKLENRPAMLFDLAADIGESHDLAAQKPDLVKELSAAFQAWDAKMDKPLWGVPTRASGPPTR